MSWLDAFAYCEKTEGHLATFLTPEEAQEASEKIYEMSYKVTSGYLHGTEQSEYGLNRRYWIGLTDLSTGEGHWVWAGKGAPLSYNTLWFPGQPDHYDSNGVYLGRPEHCAAFWNPVFHKGNRRHTFADMECTLKYYFICENDPEKLKTQNEYLSSAKDIKGRAAFPERDRPRYRKKEGRNAKDLHDANELGKLKQRDEFRQLWEDYDYDKERKGAKKGDRNTNTTTTTPKVKTKTTAATKTTLKTKSAKNATKTTKTTMPKANKIAKTTPHIVIMESKRKVRLLGETLEVKKKQKQKTTTTSKTTTKHPQPPKKPK